MALMKHTLLFLALAALLTFTLALPLSPLASEDLVARGKVGNAKPPAPPAQPPVKPPAKPPVTPPAPVTPPVVSKCNGFKALNGQPQCNACVASPGCAFDRTLTQCIPTPTGRLDANRFVTQVEQCKTIGQGLNADPTADVKARAQAEFNRMRNHIFVGETDPSSGRHTFSAWTAKNKDAGICDKATHLCAFKSGKKTVWDDRSGLYTQRDIEDICLTAITLNIQDNSNAQSSAQFAIQTKFGRTICVQHLVTKSNTPSCFPVGIHPTSSKLGDRCGDTGTAKNADTEDVPASK